MPAESAYVSKEGLILIRVIILVLLLLLIFYLLARYRRLDIDRQKNARRFLALMAFSALLIALILSGRISWLFALLGGLLPLIPRLARFGFGAWPAIRPYFQRYQQNRQSSMRARYVSLQIDMLSGALQGEVLEGEFAGQKLQILSREQLLSLLRDCQQHDAPSAALLVAYLDREKSGWKDDDDGAYKEQASRPGSDSVMGVQQAREILGVDDEAGRKVVIKAHKQLMQKMHPDRGGSVYLAGQINKARDVLLAEMS